MPPKRKKDYPCLKCDNHVKKNDEGIECYLCNQWSHRACSDVTDEVFKFLEQQVEYQGGTFWACKACRVVAIKFDKRMKEIDKRIDDIEDTANTNEQNIQSLQDDLAALRIDTTKNNPDLGQVQSATQSSVFNEIAERDKRKLNVIVHGIAEADPAVTDGKLRMTHDLQKLQELLNEIQVQLDTSDRSVVKFAKRLGQAKADSTRPILVALSSTEAVEKVISGAKLLRNKKDPWSKMSAARDLTTMQREEEKKLSVQAANLNSQLSADDAKNFQHKVVGPRGEKRIAKVSLKRDAAGT